MAPLTAHPTGSIRRSSIQRKMRPWTGWLPVVGRPYCVTTPDQLRRLASHCGGNWPMLRATGAHTLCINKNGESCPIRVVIAVSRSSTSGDQSLCLPKTTSSQDRQRPILGHNRFLRGSWCWPSLVYARMHACHMRRLGFAAALDLTNWGPKTKAADSSHARERCEERAGCRWVGRSSF